MIKLYEARKKIPLKIFMVLCFIVLFGVAKINVADAATELRGWAWSSSIGWISMKCEQPEDNYCGNPGPGTHSTPVNKTTGFASGYMLANPRDNLATDDDGNIVGSSNIGYIDVAPDLSSVPTGTGNVAQGLHINIETGEVSGWARFCAVFQSGCSGALKSDEELGGWTGWLSFKGNNHQVIMDTTTLELSGYAWGGEVVGWVDFSGVTLYIEDLYISATPTTTNYLQDYKTTISAWSNQVGWYTCEHKTEPSPTEWDSFVSPYWVSGGWIVGGEDPIETIATVPAPETVFSIRCKTGPTEEWSDWESVTVYMSDLWVNADACYAENEGLNIQYGNHSTNTDFVSCTASNSAGLAGFSGSVTPPPLGGYEVINLSSVDPAIVEAGITFEMTCIDENGYTHSPIGPESDTVNTVCDSSPNPPPVVPSALLEMSACIDSDILVEAGVPWGEFPADGITQTIKAKSDGEADILGCVGDASPDTTPASNFEGLNIQPLQTGSWTEIPTLITEYGMSFTLNSCEDTYGRPASSNSVALNGGICNVDPRPDIKGVLNDDFANPYDDISGADSVQPGELIDIIWEQDANYLGAECYLSSVFGDNGLTNRTLQDSEVGSGQENDVIINSSSLFSLYCYIPAYPEKNGQDTLRVCVDGDACPAAEVQGGNIPIFEEI